MTFKRWLQRTLNRLRGVPLVLACLAMGACDSEDKTPPASVAPVPGVTLTEIHAGWTVYVLRVEDKTAGVTCYVASSHGAHVACVPSTREGAR